MCGTSYGGFTWIQVAMHRPPSLKAIVPLYATDDRYTDDCHYSPGGNMRMYYDVGTYGGNMVAMNALPPSAEGAGPKWAEMWKSRLEKNEPYLLKWMQHQVDGAYWRVHRSRPKYDRIECPAFLIAGWHDGYANTMLRTFTHLKAPKKLLMGPWVHPRPNISVPGPRIDYLNEMARFFAHHLRDEETGIMREPAVSIYMQESPPPMRTLDVTPGHWRAERSFPAEGTQDVTFHLSLEVNWPPGRRGREPRLRRIRVSPGGRNLERLLVGRWDEFLPGRRPEGGRGRLGLLHEPPFERDTEILGWPRVILHASASARVATFVAKLADVAPDGSSSLIVDGSLNATRRNSLSDPAPLEPEKIYALDIPMAPTGWVLKPGHRLRLAVSSSDFPNLWPTPKEPATGSIGAASIPPSSSCRFCRPRAPLLPSSCPRRNSIRQSGAYGEPPTQQVLRDQITGAVTVINRRASTVVLEDNLGSLARDSNFRCTASELDPAQASIVGTHRYAFRREDGVYEWSPRVRSAPRGRPFTS